ncbi:hypothetical protein CD464_000857 [Escherichia coli]|nr:hypothetical protein [Escherichia coli]
MSASLAILTIGIVPMQEVLPLLTEYIDEDNISHHSLLGKLSREEVMAEYYSAAIFLIPICISFDTAEKRRYATYLILNRRFSFEF